MARLTVKQGAMELSDSELGGLDPLTDSLQVDCELGRLACARVFVKKKQSGLLVRWSYSVEGSMLTVPIKRQGSGKGPKRGKKVGGQEFERRGVLGIGDVVVWTVYGE